VWAICFGDGAMMRRNERELDDQAVLVVFRGADAFVSPSLYAPKKETGKVVPTWNYAMVQARGKATLRDQSDWLTPQLDALVTARETTRSQTWSIADAPSDYIEAQKRAIVGIEIEIAVLEGKWTGRSQDETPAPLSVAAARSGS